MLVIKEFLCSMINTNVVYSTLHDMEILLCYLFSMSYYAT